MSNIDNVEDSISKFLLRDVVFYIKEGKTLKKGKLILFRFKEFHFNFTLKNEKGDHKIYEIPYPYAHNIYDDHINFSYNIEDFTLKDSSLYYKVKAMNTSTASKLYNSMLVLSAI
jgi:hypothetical protein